MLALDEPLPDVLRTTIDGIEAHVQDGALKHGGVLRAARARLEAELHALGTHAFHLRQRNAVSRQLTLVCAALDALTPDALRERVDIDVRACVARFKDVHADEVRRAARVAQEDLHMDTRFLPTAPATAPTSAVATLTGKSSGAAKPDDFATRIAAELRCRFGVEERAVDLVSFDVCKRCNVAMQYTTALQQLVCPRPGCGYWKRFADMTSSALAFGEDLEFNKFSYHPITHLEDTIRFAEAGGAYIVPAAHLELVMKALRKRGIQPEDVTIRDVRDVVKGIKVIKAENTMQIHSRLTGRTPWRLCAYAKDQIRIMFFTQEPYFRKYCEDRVNNLSYTYTVYKFCELLGYWEMLDSVPLLRGKSNRERHDRIQSRIDDELEWEFIPTVQHEENTRVQATLRRCGINTVRSTPIQTTL